MLLETALLIAFVIVCIIQFSFSFIPLGNEDSVVRRLPWVTFSILALNILLYFATVPATLKQDAKQVKSYVELDYFLEKNPQVLASEEARQKLKERGLYLPELRMIEDQLRSDDDLREHYLAWLKGEEAAVLAVEFNERLNQFIKAGENHLYYSLGISPDGRWKAYQLITYSFVHANGTLFGFFFPMHLLLNLVAFFAVGFNLEDLWGRGIFLGFYLAASAVAGLPDAIQGNNLIGASGAVSAAMGAFLIRLPRTRLRIGWFSMPLVIPLLMAGRKPYGIAKLPGYIFLAYFITSQLLMWWYFNYKLGAGTGVSYRCHIAGFIFGVFFAVALKVLQVEERLINPQIEAKVSFEASPAVSRALELIDRGELVLAERKLKAHLAQQPQDYNALMAVIQVYRRTGNVEQMGLAYSALIKQHLKSRDKEAALMAYSDLVESVPDSQSSIRLPIRDWLSICSHLRESGMHTEAALEYERLANSYPEDSLTALACVQGGESALAAKDIYRAKALFAKASELNPGPPLSTRIEAGLNQCGKV